MIGATIANTTHDTARRHTNVLTFVKHAGIMIAMMNEKQLILIRGVMDSINDTLELYEKDPTFAPADWILENWWCTLEAAINCTLEAAINSSSNPSEEV